MAAAAPNPFQHWLAEVMQDGAGMPMEIDPLGLSFETDGRVTRIFPHADDDLAVVEVRVSSLDELAGNDLARLALQLLRLNRAARLEHDWSVVLDEADNLAVTTTVSQSATGANVLAAILQDGIDRAAALSRVVAGLIGIVAPDPDSGPGPELVLAGGAIRG
jgi:hypothetical protein